jgi:REP element-mobilizing transposase RayT
MHTPGRGDGALRRHRASVHHASYFVTLCTEGKKSGLTGDTIASAIHVEIANIESDLHWITRAGVVMPDHIHLLVQLTDQLSISRCVARLKSKTRTCLLEQHLTWQANFYEHRIRPDDSIEEVVRYIFLNPHRDDPAANRTPYPWFWLGADEQLWFTPQTDGGRPFPDWLR